MMLAARDVTWSLALTGAFQKLRAAASLCGHASYALLTQQNIGCAGVPCSGWTLAGKVTRPPR
jgi:hypothetical protein